MWILETPSAAVLLAKDMSKNQVSACVTCLELLVCCFLTLFCRKTWQGNATASSSILIQFPAVGARGVAFSVALGSWRIYQLETSSRREAIAVEKAVCVYAFSLSGWITGWMWQGICCRLAAPFMCSVLSNIGGTRLIFLAVLLFYFLKKWILSTQFLIESHHLISHVWSDLFLCCSLNEITTDSLHIASRQRSICRKSWGFFLWKSFEVLRLRLICQYLMMVSAT